MGSITAMTEAPMKGADSCAQWQDICMSNPLTLGADTQVRGLCPPVDVPLAAGTKT